MSYVTSADARPSLLNEALLQANKPLIERAYPGLHAEVLTHLLRLVKTPVPVLDLACGTGAWLARLRQQGFSDAVGIDGSADAFGFEKAKFICADLNHSFAEKIERRFDVITAIEIIEHLESPANFLQQARSLTNQDGYLFVTTPNVECIQGRLRFLLQGKLRAFEDESIGDPTHISPILTSLLPRLTERSGWYIQERIPLLTKTSRYSVRMFCNLLRPFVSGATEGDCHLFILRPR